MKDSDSLDSDWGAAHNWLPHTMALAGIMEGDLIRTIRDNHKHTARYHTARVPGRREIDASV